MTETVPDGAVRLGARLRKARQRRQLSLEQLAQQTGLTKGFISQIERDLAVPSVASLLRVCEALQIGIGSLFATSNASLVRGAEAPPINFGGDRLTERLLTPRGNTDVVLIRSVIEPGGGSGNEPYTLDADTEVVYVVSGELEITVNGRQFSLQPSDTLTFAPRDPHAWQNPSQTQTAVVIWTLTPSPF